MTPRRWLAAALAVQVALVAWTAVPRLLPRVSGDEYRVLVEPLDPIDPFRGAYVALAYGGGGETYDIPEGPAWRPLRRSGRDWQLGDPVARRPTGPAVRCEVRDFGSRCGIESFFASQAEAKRLEGLVGRGGAVAIVRVDGAGRAAIVGLEAR